MLWADNLSFRYTPRSPLVVDGVSLQIERGGLVGILGPNGSGKTTLLGLLSGTHRASAGRVTLDRVDVSSLSRREMARRVAMVAQHTLLAFDYRVIEIVLMGRHPHLGPLAVEGPDDVALAMDALEATGTSTLADRPFRTLSGGEQQRVVIASALAQTPQLLLLDEPTASLDLGYQLEIAALLERLNRERHVTLVMSTHDLNLAASLCRELVLMRNGRIIAAGPTAEVLTAEHVRRLYDVDADIQRHHETGRVTVVPLRHAPPAAPSVGRG